MGEEERVCHYALCQAGHVILSTAPAVKETFNVAYSIGHTPEYKTLYFHPGCHKAAHA